MSGLPGLLALFVAALFAGAAVYVSVAEHPARMRLDDAAALAQWKPSYQRGKLMQAGLALLGSLLAFWAWWEGRDWLWLAGGIALLANWPVTLIAILPTNHRLEAVPSGGAGPESRALLVRWGRLHAIRTMLGMIAALLMLLALALHGGGANPTGPNQAMDDCCLAKSAAPTGDTVRPRPGLWETTITPLASPSSDLNPGGGTPLADRRHIRRSCFDGREPVVGAPTPEGHCTYTNVADRGATVSRAMRCEAPRPGWTGWTTVTGVRSAESFEYHVRASLTDPQGHTMPVFENVEQGRWLGPCPSGARPAETNTAN